MTNTTSGYQPGFQGSETSWVEVIIYQHGDDPVVLASGKPTRAVLDGKREIDDTDSIISVATGKHISQASGTFTINLKPSLMSKQIFDWLVDDDWVDIIWYRHDQPWHTMRGLIDDVNRSRITSANGATVTGYTITGREWSKIFETTAVWFSPYANSELITDAVANQVFAALPQVVGPPPVAVYAYLNGFLEALESNAGVNWNPPRGMPGLTEDSFLASVIFAGKEAGTSLPNVRFDSNYYQNIPARKGFNTNYLQPQGTLWQLAKQWSDPLFTEFYADLLPNGDPFDGTMVNGLPIRPGEGKMTIVVRDKPFPTLEYTDNWDSLPDIIIPRQQIREDYTGKSGAERFNTYYIASLLTQEAMGEHALTVLAPLIDLEDIARHGMRRMDVQSQQAPVGENIDYGALTDVQRKIIRDWYALNPYMLSGTLNLGLGRPDIKVGTKVTVPGTAPDGSTNEVYYVEQVSHNFTFGPGTRTTLGVTRGWTGTDLSYREKLSTAISKYSIPVLSRKEKQQEGA